MTESIQGDIKTIQSTMTSVPRKKNETRVSSRFYAEERKR